MLPSNAAFLAVLLSFIAKWGSVFIHFLACFKMTLYRSMETSVKTVCWCVLNIPLALQGFPTDMLRAIFRCSKAASTSVTVKITWKSWYHWYFLYNIQLFHTYSFQEEISQEHILRWNDTFQRLFWNPG